MPVQTIKQDGVVVGYQARHANASKYFAVAKHGHDAAYEAAERAVRKLRREIPRQPRGLQANNSSGLNGLRLVWRPSVADNPPVLQVQASWYRRRVPGSTTFSTEVHGKVGATQRAIDALEKATGRPFPMSARQAWAVMSRRLEG